MTQMIAESYAQEFNKTSSKKKVAFLPVSVVQLQRPFMGATYVCLEPLMDGRYVKHSDNYGGVATRDELPQAFSHFTHEVRGALHCRLVLAGVFHRQIAAYLPSPAAHGRACWSSLPETEQTEGPEVCGAVAGHRQGSCEGEGLIQGGRERAREGGARGCNEAGVSVLKPSPRELQEREMKRGQ